METIPPEALLENVPPPMREVAEWLRGVVRRVLPEAEERVRAGWGVIGYDVPVGRRRTAFVAWVWAQPEHAHLGFPLGVLMADPHGVLDGAGVTKSTRWTTHTPTHRLPEAVLAELLREAARVASMSRDERVAIRMAIEDAAGSVR